MPTYEYACRDCGSHLEVVQSFTDDALTDCPTCSGTLRKVFSPIGIAFKGDGFYKTDSRSAAKSSSSSSTSESSDTKTDSKSESKADATSSSKADATSGSKSDAKSSSTSSDSSSSPAKSEAKSA